MPEPIHPPLPAHQNMNELTALRLYGLLITKDDEAIFHDWCREQLPLYDAVVCFDGSVTEQTAQIAAQYADKLIYLHERDYPDVQKTDHGLRRIVHQEIVTRFGAGHWVMCCHADEFCYHDPRKIAQRAQEEGYDLVTWFSPHFYPHPEELKDWSARSHWPVPERHRYYHWNRDSSGLPWLEDRLYRANDSVAWDKQTHGSVRPHGIQKPAPFHPILQHYKVIATDTAWCEVIGNSTYYRHHWVGLENRTGLPYPVRQLADLFVSSVRNYATCSRFEGRFEHSWNMGEQYRIPTATLSGNETQAQQLREQIRHLASVGQLAEARALIAHAPQGLSAKLQALCSNDRAALDALEGKVDEAQAGFMAALALDPLCESAQENLNLLGRPSSDAGQTGVALMPTRTDRPPQKPVKVALVSFLFNWPSTGGGIVHTVELVQFLRAAGYDAQHFYVHYPPWGIGTVTQKVPFPSHPLSFEPSAWNRTTIQERVRSAIREFEPDFVILTDSWNIKPLLAEAVAEFPYILRLQAMECLCPLNNVRLLVLPDGKAEQCPQHQLATPHECRRCLQQRGHFSGDLHRLERELSGVEQPDYPERLKRAFHNAVAVLVVNPLTEAMISPYCRSVRVVTAGMDPARFPWPPPVSATRKKCVLLFAGLMHEWMKGFHILQHACALLWQKRQDFELVVTGDKPAQSEPYIRYVGWLSQEELPKHLREADILVMPTVAQEALGRTAVEAMATGIPVIASRLGGLLFTVADGATGLLFEPGNPHDLLRKMETLLDQPELRKQMGLAGRQRFEEHYAWPVIIERHYHPLLRPALTKASTDEYQPYFPEQTDLRPLLAQAAVLFSLTELGVAQRLEQYRRVHETKRYAQRFGEHKTLCFEEAFILYLLLDKIHPASFVEIGTQEGKATRRILDIIESLALSTRVTCVDSSNQTRFITANEVIFLQEHLTGRFRDRVLDMVQPDIIFVDTHGYPLLHEIIFDTLQHCPKTILVIHDCGRGLCNPQMTIARENPDVTSYTGVWERHILAEYFGLSDPLSSALDAGETKTHRWQIFNTPHGLGVFLPTALDTKP